ncbi:hypothetical protein GE061_005275, partial [Apolygus lucorum]
ELSDLNEQDGTKLRTVDENSQLSGPAEPFEGLFGSGEGCCYHSCIQQS